jgi:hypothetical protein
VSAPDRPATRFRLDAPVRAAVRCAGSFRAQLLLLLTALAWTNVECANCGLLLSGDPRPTPLQPPFMQVGSDVVVQCPSSPSGAFLDELDD